MNTKILIYSKDAQLQNVVGLSNYIKVCYNNVSLHSPDYIVFDNLEAFKLISSSRQSSKLIFPKELFMNDPQFKKSAVFANFIKTANLTLCAKYSKENLYWIEEYFSAKFKGNNIEVLNLMNGKSNVIFGNTPFTEEKINDNRVLKDTRKNLTRRNILLLGNDNSINSLPTQLVLNSSLTVAGVNRIWKKIMPEYLFFIDPQIVDEFLQHGVKNFGSNWHTCERFFYYLKDNPIKNNIEEYLRENKITNHKNQYGFTNSTLWFMQILQNDIFPNEDCHFYFYGNSLKWADGGSHFWSNDPSFYVQTSKQWYEERFRKIYFDYKTLNSYYNMTSCDENGLLNDFLPYVPLVKVLEENK